MLYYAKNIKKLVLNLRISILVVNNTEKTLKYQSCISIWYCLIALKSTQTSKKLISKLFITI